jgi:hypothetical protein
MSPAWQDFDALVSRAHNGQTQLVVSFPDAKITRTFPFAAAYLPRSVLLHLCDRIRALKEELQRRMHEPILCVPAAPTNGKSISAFRKLCYGALAKSAPTRSQRDRSTWARIAQLAAEFSIMRVVGFLGFLFRVVT